MMDDHLVTRTLERGDYHKGDVVDLCSPLSWILYVGMYK
jgi:hypothetical protein